jgi:hypothetical protein
MLEPAEELAELNQGDGKVGINFQCPLVPDAHVDIGYHHIIIGYFQNLVYRIFQA